MSSHKRKGKFQRVRGGKFQSGSGGRKILFVSLIILAVLLAVGLAMWLLQPDGTDADIPETSGASAEASGEDPTDTQQPEDTTQTEDTQPAQTEQTQPSETQEPDTTEASTQPTQSDDSQQTGSPDNSGNQSSVAPTVGSASGGEKPTQPQDSIRLSCTNPSLFTGQFVEDGRDELVENVAAILVTNISDQYLELATINYYIDGQKATFVVTGLPAGRSAWVMEANRMTATASSVFTYLDESASYRSDVRAERSQVTITAEGNMLTATNHSNQPLAGVFVCYRTVHADGNFFGGITYLTNFGNLEPGESVEALGGHYSEDSEIVRIDWTTG